MEKLIPATGSIKIKVHPSLVDEATTFIKKAGGKAFIRKVTLGVIQAETSFTSKLWVEHGVSGLTTTAAPGSAPKDQIPNITGVYADSAVIIARKRSSSLNFNFVGFPQSSMDPKDFQPASAVASYLVNKTVRRIVSTGKSGSYNALTELAKTIGVYVTGDSSKRPDLHAKTIYNYTGWRIKDSV